MDKIIQETLEAIKEVRNSGVTNMLDKRRVLEALMMNNSDEVVDFILEHENEYLFLLELSSKL